MNEDLMDYSGFMYESYEECKNADWFPDVLDACSSLDTDDLVVSAIIGEIHEGLRINFSEALKYFWTIMLINPLIAIKAYGETDLLLGRIDVYGTFKLINPVDPSGYFRIETKNGIYNTSTENFMIFAIEALLQKTMDPMLLNAMNSFYLRGLYDHDRKIMSNKKKYQQEGTASRAKWINHKNLRHILEAIDPHHIIVLLEFFADRYGARLRKGNVREYCYSGDKYHYIIRFIKEKYGSLSEYIDWTDNYRSYYVRYFTRSLYHYEMLQYMDVIFTTEEDKRRIQTESGTWINDRKIAWEREENRIKNPIHHQACYRKQEEAGLCT